MQCMRKPMPWWCLFSCPLYQNLWPSSVDFSPNPGHLTSNPGHLTSKLLVIQPQNPGYLTSKPWPSNLKPWPSDLCHSPISMMGELLLNWCNVWTLHELMDVPSLTLIAPVAHIYCPHPEVCWCPKRSPGYKYMCPGPWLWYLHIVYIMICCRNLLSASLF